MHRHLTFLGSQNIQWPLVLSETVFLIFEATVYSETSGTSMSVLHETVTRSA